MATIKIENLKPEDYWFQGKGLDGPWLECQVTAAANYLNSMGIYPLTGKWRLPDVINDIANGVIGHIWAKSIGYEGAPREVHVILSWAINVIAGRKIDSFQLDVTMEELVCDLLHKKSCILSGYFLPDGHVVTATGIVGDKTLELVKTPKDVDLRKVDAIIVADPYGDYFSKNKEGKPYKPGESGYGIAFPINVLTGILNKSATDLYMIHRASI